MNRRSALVAITLGLRGVAGFAQRRASGEVPGDLLRLAGQCLLVGWRPAGMHPWVAARVADGSLGAVLVTHGNADSVAGLRALERGLQELVPTGGPLLIAADQEGGAVSHLSPPLPRLPPLSVLGAIDDPVLTERAGALQGRLLRDVGVNLDLAPVLDVCTDPNNGVIAGRVFGGDAAKTARHGVAFVRGLAAGGAHQCAKHFPGHGGTHADSHVELPRVGASADALRAVDLVPFRAVAATVSAMMVAHVVYEGIDREFPASLSSRCVSELLRDDVGFRGVAITDDLEMTPIRAAWGVADAAVRSIAAGNDLVTVAHSPMLADEARVALARRALADEAFYARLTEAAGRVRALRESIRPAVPDADAARGLAALFAEVRRRAPRRTQPQHDPTLRR